MKETRFKNTELGPVPQVKPWTTKRLGDVCDINRGGSPRPIETYLTSNPDGINWIKIGDVSPDSKYISKTLEKIKPEGVKFSRKVVRGDFILSNSMSFGRPYIMATDGCIHDGWLMLHNYEANYNIDFLYYILSSEVVFKQYLTAAAGSSVKNLNKEKVANLIIIAPEDKAEQERIAEALSDVDALIAELGELIEKKRLVKQGAMQQLLTAHRRLPGFSKPWKEYCISELFDSVGNNTLSREQLGNEGTVLDIHYGDILVKYGEVTDLSKTDVPKIIGQSKAKHPLQNGDIVMADTAEDELVGKVTEIIGIRDDIQAEAGLHTIVLRPKIKFSLGFLGYLLNDNSFHDQLLPHIQGIKVSSISKGALKKLMLKVPSDIAEQRAIAEILTDMDKEIAELEAKRRKYQAVKEGMMQELLNGRIRLIPSATTQDDLNADNERSTASPIVYDSPTSYPSSLAAEP